MQILANVWPKLLAVFAVASFILISGNAAQAQILLTIDDSNPAATIITATGIGPVSSAGPTLILEGIDLTSFFTSPLSNFPTFPVTSSSLTVGNGSSDLTFNEAVNDNESLQDVDLSLYNNDPTGTISFTAGDPAFVGTLTLDLSSSTSLPAAGAKGTIVTGYSGSASNTVIGQWQVASAAAVPEPSTWGLVLGSVALLALVRRFRRA
jgi:hypothetical protein